MLLTFRLAELIKKLMWLKFTRQGQNYCNRARHLGKNCFDVIMMIMWEIGHFGTPHKIKHTHVHVQQKMKKINGLQSGDKTVLEKSERTGRSVAPHHFTPGERKVK